MELKVMGTVDLGNRVQVFMSKPVYAGLGGNRRLTGEHSYWWVVIGKGYWASYEKGGKSLSDVLGSRLLTQTFLDTVVRKLGKEVLHG